MNPTGLHRNPPIGLVLRRCRDAALVIALSWLLAGDGSSGRVADLRPSPQAVDLVSPTGCEVDAPTGRISGPTVTDGTGRARSFEVFVTAGYSRHRAVPLLLVFHGLGGGPNDGISTAYVRAVAESGDQAVVVMPQGIEYGRDGIGWDQSCGGRDMPFYDAMIREVSARYCIDAQRIYASGFSWGADMVDALSCCRGDTLRAVAPFSGDETDVNPRCNSVRYPAARIRYGTRFGEAGDGVYKRAQFREATEFFRRAQQCQPQADAIGPGPCVRYRGCTRAVVECERPELGHDAPSRDELADTWGFFRSQR